MAASRTKRIAHNFQDLTGRTFGRYTVLRRAPNEDAGTRWHCRCSCGTERIVCASVLRGGTTKSCGCLHRELAAARRTTHGLFKAPEYPVWQNMITRCTNPRSDRWNTYGGRGITVCERWLKSFANFYIDMGQRPTPQHQINRVDNDGPYCPGNCVWATRKQQANNKTNSSFLTWNGETLTVSEWSHRTGIKMATIWARVHLLGWDVERALTAPVQYHHN